MPRTNSTSSDDEALLTVIVDEQEKRPWTFSPDVAKTERRSLRTGDYTVAGLEGVLCIERKSLGDFVESVFRDWIRFRKRLYRMAAFDIAAVVIEATPAQVERHEYESEALPQSVLGRAHSIYLDHGVPVFWWQDHETAARMALQFMQLAVRKHGRVIDSDTMRGE